MFGLQRRMAGRQGGQFRVQPLRPDRALPMFGLQGRMAGRQGGQFRVQPLRPDRALPMFGLQGRMAGRQGGQLCIQLLRPRRAFPILGLQARMRAPCRHQFGIQLPRPASHLAAVLFHARIYFAQPVEVLLHAECIGNRAPRAAFDPQQGSRRQAGSQYFRQLQMGAAAGHGGLELPLQRHVGRDRRLVRCPARTYSRQQPARKDNERQFVLIMRPGDRRAGGKRLEQSPEKKVAQGNAGLPRPLQVDEMEFAPRVFDEVVRKHVQARTGQQVIGAGATGEQIIERHLETREDRFHPGTQPVAETSGLPAIRPQSAVQAAAPCLPSDVLFVNGRTQVTGLGDSRLRGPQHAANDLGHAAGMPYERSLLAERPAPLHRVVITRTTDIVRSVDMLDRAHMGDNHERVGHVGQQAVFRQHGPGAIHREKRVAAEVRIASHRRFGQGHAIVEPGHCARAIAQQHRRGQLVVGKRQSKSDLGESRFAQHRIELQPSIRPGPAPFVEIADPQHGPPEVVLGRSGKILQPQLVLDRQQQHAAWIEHGTGQPQPVHRRIIALAEAMRILQHPDQRHRIETFAIAREGFQVVNDDPDILLPIATGGSHPGPGHRGFQRNEFLRRVPEEPAQRATARADLQHPPLQQGCEWPEQAGTARAEVIARRPVDDPLRQFRGQHGTIAAGEHRFEKLALDLFAIAVVPFPRLILAQPTSDLLCIPVGAGENGLFFLHRTFNSACRSVTPRNSVRFSTQTWIAS